MPFHPGIERIAFGVMSAPVLKIFSPRRITADGRSLSVRSVNSRSTVCQALCHIPTLHIPTAAFAMSSPLDARGRGDRRGVGGVGNMIRRTAARGGDDLRRGGETDGRPMPGSSWCVPGVCYTTRDHRGPPKKFCPYPKQCTSSIYILFGLSACSFDVSSCTLSSDFTTQRHACC